MHTPSTSQKGISPVLSRYTFRTVGDVVRHIRELIGASVLGLNDLSLQPQISARDRLMLQSLAALRLRTVDALLPMSTSAEKTEKVWTQYSAVFQIQLTVREDLKNASSTLEATETISRVDELLVAALTSMKDDNPTLTVPCESITCVLCGMERRSSMTINGARDM